MHNLVDDLYLKIINIVSDKQVDSAVIIELLECFCKKYHYQSGFVYEIDQYNVFHIKEQYKHTGESMKTCFFTLETFSSCFLQRIASEKTIYIVKDTASKEELLLLEILQAHSMVMVSLVDECQRIFGFLMLVNGEIKNRNDTSALSLLLPLFAKYISIRMYQNKIMFTKRSLDSIIDNSGIDIYVKDFYTDEILYVNNSMAAPYGGVEKFMKYKCWENLYPGQNGPCSFCPQKDIIDESGNPTGVYTWNYKRSFDEKWFRVFSTAFQWSDGRLAHVVSSADITENKRNEELIQYLANYDSLTKLPNRRMLIDECEKRIDQSKDDVLGFVLFFDIDGFKEINDTYGHDEGDDFLCKIGAFFMQIPLLKNSIYRNGGDEFIAIIDNVTKADVKKLALSIHHRFCSPWQLKKATIMSDISIGIACYPEDGNTAEKLIHVADQAMYEVKKRGGSGVLFGNERDTYKVCE